MGRVRTYERSGLTFDVTDSGPKSGTPVVCLHGFPQDSSAYDAVGEALVAQGCRVLVPNQRGYSPGARPASRSAYVVPELVADIIALLDAARLPNAHVVGHDWGGAVAWALAAARPKRVRSLTALSTPHPSAMLWGSVTCTQALRSSYMAAFQLPILPERVILARDGSLLLALLRRSGLPEEQATRYVDRMREPGVLSSALAWYRALVLPSSPLGPVGVPTTFLTGDLDPAFAERSIALTASYVTGEYEHRGLRAGHWLPETRPAVVAGAVLAHVQQSR